MTVSLEEAIYADLSTEASVIALAGTRGYPELIPNGVALPAWAYQRIDSDREKVLTHARATPVQEGTVQITCQAATYAAAKGLAAAIVARLHGFKGTLGGLTVHRIVVGGDQDGLADEDGATVRMDVRAMYSE